NGLMDGFVAQAERGFKCSTNDPSCSPCEQGQSGKCIDVMGYHDAREIPNYWKYARDFVLQDHMFEPNASWSLPEHLFQVSEWSASCTQRDNPSSCENALQGPGLPPDFGGRRANGQPRQDPIYAWTDMTYLLHQNQVPWGYYVVSGTEPDCQNDAAVSCAPVRQNATTPGIWNA